MCHIAYYKEGEEKDLKLKKAAVRSISFLYSLSLQKVWGGNTSMKNERTMVKCPLHHLPTVSSMSSSVNTHCKSSASQN